MTKGRQGRAHSSSWRTGRVSANQGLAQDPGECRQGGGAARAAPGGGGEGSIWPASSSGVHTGQKPHGGRHGVHPQDPAKARWLAGSGALVSGLLLFLLLPPLLFCHMEGWSYVESFYFAFITLSTVGFGDYVIGERPP